MRSFPLIRAVGAIILVAVLAGCGLGAANPQPTPVPPTATATEVPQVVVNPASGGLGLTTSEWLAVRGEPVVTQFGDAIARYPGDGNFYVDIPSYTDPKQITQMDFDFSPPVELEAAEAVVGQYLPADAERLDECRDDLSDGHVVLYHSAWLAETINPDGEFSTWLGTEPGSFFALYGWRSNDPSTERVAYVMVALSHSP